MNDCCIGSVSSSELALQSFDRNVCGFEGLAAYLFEDLDDVARSETFWPAELQCRVPSRRTVQAGDGELGDVEESNATDCVFTRSIDRRFEVRCDQTLWPDSARPR